MSMAGPNPKRTDMDRSIRHRILPYLVLLLAVQLTGMSCLDDWHDAAFSLHSADHHHAVSAQSTHAHAIDDTCPCHLAFVTAPDNAYSVESPVAPLSAGLRLTSPHAEPSAPFHPPLAS